jgi:uroporphyrinogen-III synthase
MGGTGVSLALGGRRILVTRAGAQAGSLSDLLQKAGAEVVEVPLIEIEAGDEEALAREVGRLAEYQLLVFTSANAVRAVTAIPAAGAALAGSPRPRVVAVGPATRAALADAGLPADVVGSGGGAEGIAEVLAREDLKGSRALFPRAAQGREELVEWLRGAGVEVVVLYAYRTIGAPGSEATLRAALAAGIDMVTFASPSAIEAFISTAVAGQPRTGFQVACIGPTTAEAARAVGFPVAVVAAEQSAAGLVDAIVDHYLMQTGHPAGDDVLS